MDGIIDLRIDFSDAAGHTVSITNQSFVLDRAVPDLPIVTFLSDTRTLENEDAIINSIDEGSGFPIYLTNLNDVQMRINGDSLTTLDYSDLINGQTTQLIESFECLTGFHPI